MKPTLTDIIAAIPTLTPAEQDQVASAVKAAQALGAGTRAKGRQYAPGRVDLPPDARDVLTAICGYMARHFGDPTAFGAAAALKDYRDMEPKCTPIMEAIRGQVHTVTTQRALLDVGIGLLIADMDDQGYAPTIRTVMRQAHRIPALIRKAFPGYADSGLMHVIMQSRTERNYGG